MSSLYLYYDRSPSPTESSAPGHVERVYFCRLNGHEEATATLIVDAMQARFGVLVDSSISMPRRPRGERHTFGWTDAAALTRVEQLNAEDSILRHGGGGFGVGRPDLELYPGTVTWHLHNLRHLPPEAAEAVKASDRAAPSNPGGSARAPLLSDGERQVLLVLAQLPEDRALTGKQIVAQVQKLRGGDGLTESNLTSRILPGLEGFGFVLERRRRTGYRLEASSWHRAREMLHLSGTPASGRGPQG